MMDQSSKVGKYICLIIIINTQNTVNLPKSVIHKMVFVDREYLQQCMFPHCKQCRLFIPVITVICKSGLSRYISILLP